jgi:hypothetical protein
VLVADGSESALRQLISSAGHRHREHRPDTSEPPVPGLSLVMVTMPPRTTALLILAHSDAVDPVPGAVQQSAPHPTGLGAGLSGLSAHSGPLRGPMAWAWLVHLPESQGGGVSARLIDSRRCTSQAGGFISTWRPSQACNWVWASLTEYLGLCLGN